MLFCKWVPITEHTVPHEVLLTSGVVTNTSSYICYRYHFLYILRVCFHSLTFWNLIFTLLPTIILRSFPKPFSANNLGSQVLETTKYSTFLTTWSLSHLFSIALRMKIGPLYYFTLYPFPPPFPHHFHVSSLVAQISPSFYLAY